MGRINAPLLAFNQGLIDRKALARVDVDRTQLSAEVYTNWIPKTQGQMRLRPGTKYVGSSYNDTGAYFVEFVASLDQVGLLELTPGKMRVWQGSDAHDLSLLSRPAIGTNFALNDTGWTEDNVGGGTRASNSLGAFGEIPRMTGETTSGIKVTGSSYMDTGEAKDFFGITFEGNPWHIGDLSPNVWVSSTDSGISDTGWVQVDFGTSKAIQKVRITSGAISELSPFAPGLFEVQGTNDTGLGVWTTEISADTGVWSPGETRDFEDTGFTDTGANAWRYWRVLIKESADPSNINAIAELQMFLSPSDTGQTVISSAGSAILNAGARGSIARLKKSVVVDTGDIGVEHSIDVDIGRGPVTFRVGSAEGEDDLVGETRLAEGCHNLAFVPSASPFHITVQTSDTVDRVINSIKIGDTGTVEIEAPWTRADLSNIRYDQSADVVFVDAAGRQQQRIERRGGGASVGRSWSVVRYYSDFGPFRPSGDVAVRLNSGFPYGNTTLRSNVPFFKPGHVGALFKVTHTGQSGTYKLGNLNAATDAAAVVGISGNDADTGTPSSDDERLIAFTVTGTYSGQITIERSFESEFFGFHDVNPEALRSGNLQDTGTFAGVVVDTDDNSTVWYRARMSDYTSGTAFVAVLAEQGVKSGIFRATEFTNSQAVGVEVLRPPSDTGSTEDWQEGSWSNVRGFPSSVALHEGRLGHAGKGSLWLSISDDYANFDEDVEGDAAPINRTFGAGPVEDIFYMASMRRLLAGSADSELVIRSSSFDEILTPTNTAARRVSSQGSANLRPIKRDEDIFFVQRSNERFYRLAFSGDDFETTDMTVFVPKLLSGGVTSIAIQRQPDTRMHLVLADGRVAILTYEPVEETLAWSVWQGDTGTNASVEEVNILPGVSEDAVFYHVRRTINGETKRFLEKWAKEDEAEGDTGLSFLVDCAKSYTHDTGDGRTSVLSGFGHLVGASLVVWADDTGQSNAGKDLSPDVSGVQTKYSVDTGTPAVSSKNLIPIMEAETTDGVTILASSWDEGSPVAAGGQPWRVGDGDASTYWLDTGVGGSSLPSSVWVRFPDAKKVRAYSVGAGNRDNGIDNLPTAWTVIAADHDTGTFLTDTGKWVLKDSQSGVTDWSRGDTKTFNMNDADTGSVDEYKVWAFIVSAVNGDTEAAIPSLSLFGEQRDKITLNEEVHHAVAGLPFVADWKSTKLAYAAEAGTALAQMKRTDKMALILFRTHNNGLFYGNDTGLLDPLPRMLDNGAQVDADQIFDSLDTIAIPFPGLWDTDARVHLRAKSPRPCTVMALVPTVQTNEKN